MCFVVSLHEFNMQGSLDMSMFVAVRSSKAPPPLTEHNTPAKKTNGAADLYSLLYAHKGDDANSTVPPSRWETFDCKTTI